MLYDDVVGTLLLHIPNAVVDDDLDDDPNVALNIFNVDPAVDVANPPLDANLDVDVPMADRCKSQSRH